MKDSVSFHGGNMLILSLLFAIQSVHAAENPVPVPFKKPKTIQVSEACYNVFKNFEWKKYPLSERMVGFWEPQDLKPLGISLRGFWSRIGKQRDLVADRIRETRRNVSQSQYLRGVLAALTGWGNCGEHTSGMWVDLFEQFKEDGSLAGCEGAQVFKTDVSVSGKEQDHVWIEVWVPQSDAFSFQRMHSNEEPLFIDGTRNGKAGYYFVMDASADERGPYGVIRKMVYETENRIPSIHEISFNRVFLNPKDISISTQKELVSDAFRIHSQIETRDRLRSGKGKVEEMEDYLGPFTSKSED